MSMKPITLANLGYALGKLKEFFVQIKDAVLSVNGNTPDELGDVQIRRVDYAGDIESTSTQISTGDFIQRTSGGSASIESGDAWLAQVYGNSVHTGYIPESIEMTVTPISQETPITAEINEDTFRSKMSASGTVTFTYTTDWSINPATYGITVTGTPSAGDQIVVVYVMEDRGTITNAEPETFVSTGWNLYSHTLGYAKVVRYSDTNGYRIDGDYSALAFATTPTGTQQSVSVTDHVFNPPADGYIIVTGGNSTDTSITPTWDDWIDEANNGEWEGYEADTIDLSILFGEGKPFPKGLCKVGTARDEINISLAQAISRIEVIEYSAAALAEARASGRDYDVDEDTIYLVRATPDTTTISISGAHECADHGIEYFTGTELEVGASIIYGTNLRNKLERDVLTISQQSLTSTQKTQVRSNIGLGTAATYGVVNNVTTSSSGYLLDARQGKALQTNITSTYKRFPIDNITNLDTVPTTLDISPNSAYYMVRFSATATNNPSSNPGVCMGYAYTTNTESQLAFVSGETKIYTRTKISGTWNAWKSVNPS